VAVRLGEGGLAGVDSRSTAPSLETKSWSPALDSRMMMNFRGAEGAP
jgi:hypothetical protein